MYIFLKHAVGNLNLIIVVFFSSEMAKKKLKKVTIRKLHFKMMSLENDNVFEVRL